MITNTQIKEIAQRNGLAYAALKAFIEVESSGKGFGSDGKLIIQFEPSWMARRLDAKGIHHTYKNGVLTGNATHMDDDGVINITPISIKNGVEVQRKEWEAFNKAWKIDPDSAMEATSIGLPQIMGFHYARLGYASAGDMWDDFKRGEYQQILALVRFIKTDARLYRALQLKDWHTVASIYNGSGYRKLAKRLGREPYDVSMRKAYEKYAND